MARVAYTENGEQKFVRTDQPLPTTNASTRGVEGVLVDIEHQLKLLNKRIEECFNTGVPLE